MTKKEALQVLAILKAAYPNSFNGMNQKEAMGTVAIWSTHFANLSADIVLMAVNKAISTSKFPPSIAEVKEKLSSIHWEAYEMICRSNNIHKLSEEHLKLYKRIYEETKSYKHTRAAEPTLKELMIGNAEMGVKMIE